MKSKMQPTVKRLITLLICMSVQATMARDIKLPLAASRGAGGGGGFLEQEWVARAYAGLQVAKKVSDHFGMTEEQLKTIENAMTKVFLKVVPESETQITGPDGKMVQKDAKNIPELSQIKLTNTFANKPCNNQISIAFHEYAAISGVEEQNTYTFSSQLLSYLDEKKEDDRVQNFLASINFKITSTGAIFIRDTSHPTLGVAYRDESGLIWGETVKIGGRVDRRKPSKAMDLCNSGSARLPTIKEYQRLSVGLGRGSASGYVENVFKDYHDDWNNFTGYVIATYFLGFKAFNITSGEILNSVNDEFLFNFRCVIESKKSDVNDQELPALLTALVQARIL